MSLFVSALCRSYLNPDPSKASPKTPYIVADVALSALLVAAGVLVFLAAHKVGLGPFDFMAKVPHQWSYVLLGTPIVLFLFDMCAIPIFLKQKEQAEAAKAAQLKRENAETPLFDADQAKATLAALYQNRSSARH